MLAVAALLNVDFFEVSLSLTGAGAGLKQPKRAIDPLQLRALAAAVRGVSMHDPATTLPEPMPDELDIVDLEAGMVVAARDLPADTVLTEDMLVIKAPRSGVSPSFKRALVGARLLYAVRADDEMTFGLVEAPIDQAAT
jgi:sialic acid synthase SpsE